ncbi:YqeB family protein [Streptomyces sp. RGM 3693]|uniref:YqeB family protein n=1 Tax=Streptomyces sp. RGM 3693 TaxID=3413284 RepID=UPI003D2AFBE8
MDIEKPQPTGSPAGPRAEPGQPARPTVLADSPAVVATVCVLFAAVGACLGWLVRLLAKWLVTLEHAPWQGPARLLTAIPEPWLTIGVLSVGAALGLAVALFGQHEELAVSVSDDEVVLTRRAKPRAFSREAVHRVFRDGKELVLLAADTAELAREGCSLNAQRLAEAFRAHGYAWADGDPHEDEFRRWVPDTPGLPVGANALFTARERALGKSGTAEDARELRDELARLGVVVRDKDKRQFWRLVP